MKKSTFDRKTKADKQPLKAFLTKLDEIVPEDLGTIAIEEDAKMWANTNCLECANCCKKMTPTFTPEDVKRISAHLKMSVKDFRNKWTYVEENGDTVNKTTPCQFLGVDNKCSIYEVRPLDCAEFPHHTKQPLDLYNDTLNQNLDYCPATFEFVSRLKKRVEKDYEW